MEIKAIVDCKTLLGEGPLWDVAEQKIYWIDSLGDRIFRADENGDGVESWSVPQHIGSMALREKGGAVLSLAEGFYLFDFETGKAEAIETIAQGTEGPHERRQGRQARPFVAGSMDTTGGAARLHLQPALTARYADRRQHHRLQRSLLSPTIRSSTSPTAGPAPSGPMTRSGDGRRHQQASSARST